LFNLCFEPLLQAVSRECAGFGTLVGSDESQIEFLVQVYEGGVIFISKTAEGIKVMLKLLQRFVDWSRMEVNGKKYAIASDIGFRDVEWRCWSRTTCDIGQTYSKND
jgi:hypothetical protein